MPGRPSGHSRKRAGALEGEVLAILWAAIGPMTATEVLAACSDQLAYNTVHTILTRLHQKGRIRRVGPPGRSAYEPVQPAAEATAEQMRAVLDSGVDRSEALTRFVSALSPDDEAVLRAALDDSP